MIEMKNDLKCIKKSNIFVKFLKDYNKLFFKKQILVFIISLVIFMIAFSIAMSTIDFKAPLLIDVNNLANFRLLSYSYMFAIVLTILLALIPFIKNLSIITVFYSYYMAFNVSNMFYMPNINKTFLAFSVIIGLFALSLDIVFSLELSHVVNEKFYKKMNKNLKESKRELCDKNILLILFLAFMMLSIINLVVIKFI